MKIIDNAALRPEANNLAFVRLCLASAVIYSHCKWLLTGTDADVWSTMIGEPISGIAVDGFFFLSGFLVYRSLSRKADAVDFFRARLNRLWPGLAVMVVFVTVLGFSLGAQIGRNTIGFVVRNLLLQGGIYSLDGSARFTSIVPFGLINGSLWSISWEVQCYVLLALLALFGMATRARMKLFVLTPILIFALLYHFVPGSNKATGIYFVLGRIDRLWSIFLLGAAAMIWREKIVMDWRIAVAIALLAVAVHQTGLHTHIEGLAVGYWVLWLGFGLPQFSGKWPDYSYGMYIYAFPVMVLLGATQQFTDFRLLALANAAATVPIAALSWHLIEHPALNNGRSPISRTSRFFGLVATIVLFIPGQIARLVRHKPLPARVGPSSVQVAEDVEPSAQSQVA